MPGQIFLNHLVIHSYAELTQAVSFLQRDIAVKGGNENIKQRFFQPRFFQSVNLTHNLSRNNILSCAARNSITYNYRTYIYLLLQTYALKMTFTSVLQVSMNRKAQRAVWDQSNMVSSLLRKLITIFNSNFIDNTAFPFWHFNIPHFCRLSSRTTMKPQPLTLFTSEHFMHLGKVYPHKNSAVKVLESCGAWIYTHRNTGPKDRGPKHK